MNKIKIEISGPAGTFGAIGQLITETLKKHGAEVSLSEYYENVDLPFPETNNAIKQQIENRKIHIHLNQLPWGG